MCYGDFGSLFRSGKSTHLMCKRFEMVGFVVVVSVNWTRAKYCAMRTGLPFSLDKGTKWKLATWLEFCPANQLPKSTIKKEKKPMYLCAPPKFLSVCPPRLIIIQSCYFDYRVNKPFTSSCCVIWVRSLDLDVLLAQRIMGLFYLITHKSMRSANTITRSMW